MTIANVITASGSFTIGGSSAYPVLDVFKETMVPFGPDSQSAHTMVRRTWRWASVHIAANELEQHTARATLQSTLAVNGQTVTVTLAGGGNVRTAPATGASGSIAGYPRVTIEIDETRTTGRVIWFFVTVETVIPVVQAESGGFNLVEHDWTIDTSIDEDGRETITRRGTARVRPDQIARAWAQATVIDPAEADAATVGDSFIVRWTEGPDPAVVRYEYTRNAPPEGGSSPGVIDAEVVDRTSKDRNGRIVRTISGSAKGANAATFATSQMLTQTATLKLLRDQVSAPRVPDGRVDFSFEYLSGATVGTFVAGAVVFAYTERIEEIPGGRAVRAATFHDADASLYRDEREPWGYAQTTTVEFTNATFDAAEASTLMEGLLDSDNLIRAPRRRRETTREGTQILSIDRGYLYATQQTLPDPRKVETL